MGKVIFKSAIIALISTIGVLSLTVGMASIVSPKLMANLCAGVGLKSSAVYYYRIDYERHADFDRLVFLVNEADYADDEKTLAYYGEKLINSEEFSSFCAKEDEGKGYLVSSYDYYCYLTVRAMFAVGRYEKACSFAVDKTDGYTNSCPFKVAIMTARERNVKAEIDEVVSSSELLKSKITEGKEDLQKDIENLNK